MAILEKQRKYNAKNIKRIPLDIQISDYKLIRAQADHNGEKVNGYIKTAIWQRMDREGIDTSRLKSKNRTKSPGQG